MNIFWPDPHFNLTVRMSIAMNALGHKLVIPSKDYVPTFRGPTREWVWADNWTNEFIEKNIPYKNAVALNKEEILDLKPEVVICSCYESQFEILNELMPKLPKTTKLVFFSGNDYYAPINYPYFLIKNYFYGDYTANQECKKYNVPHTLYYRPFMQYDKYRFTGGSTELSVGTYICGFQENFKECYNFSKELARQNEYVAHVFHDKSSNEEVIKSMTSSMATLHIKPAEGIGFSIIESMACGRPVFLHRQLSQNRSYTQWAIENVTALYISSPEEYKAKLKALTESKDYREWLQASTASNIRRFINNEEQTEALGKFLENLQ